MITVCPTPNCRPISSQRPHVWWRVWSVEWESLCFLKTWTKFKKYKFLKFVVHQNVLCHLSSSGLFNVFSVVFWCSALSIKFWEKTKNILVGFMWNPFAALCRSVGKLILGIRNVPALTSRGRQSFCCRRWKPSAHLAGETMGLRWNKNYNCLQLQHYRKLQNTISDEEKNTKKQKLKEIEGKRHKPWVLTLRQMCFQTTEAPTFENRFMIEYFQMRNPLISVLHSLNEHLLKEIWIMIKKT